MASVDKQAGWVRKAVAEVEKRKAIVKDAEEALCEAQRNLKVAEAQEGHARTALNAAVLGKAYRVFSHDGRHKGWKDWTLAFVAPPYCHTEYAIK